MYMFFFSKAACHVLGVAPDGGEHPAERRVRPPHHRVEHRQGDRGQRHRLPRGDHLLHVLQQVKTNCVASVLNRGECPVSRFAEEELVKNFLCVPKSLEF